jgi:hypothetical protein
MLSHIATDLHKSYLEEVFKPQLGKPGASTPEKPTSSSDLDGDGDTDSFEKKVRQFIYDVRHLMRKNNIPVERAFQMRSSKTNYGAEVIKTAKEKLGIKSGGTTPVAEEAGYKEKLFSIVINYKNGTTYRKRTSRAEISRLRSNPNVSSVEMTRYGVDGIAKKDYDGDGKIESGSKEHAGAVHNAIQRKTGGTPDGQDTRKKISKKKLKSYGVSEGFSNWRQDLKEVMGVDDEIASRNEKQIKEKKVDNYGGGKNSVVKINPEVTEEINILGGHIVESFELDESYVNQVVEIATEFFYNCGLNENGVDIVIEELGEEKFNEFVFDLAEEYILTEERSAKKRKSGKSYDEIKAEIDAKEAARKKITSDKTKNAVKSATETQAPSKQPRKKSIQDRVAGFILKGIERDRAARETASKLVGKTGQTLKKAASVGSKAAAEFAKGVKSGVETTADVTKKTKKAVVGEEYIGEKAESEQQQKLFGLALSVKRGETPRSEASAEVLKIVDSMSEKKIRDFAKTPHSEVPKKKVNEAISNPTSERKSPPTTQKQKETGRIIVLQKLLDLAKQDKLGEDMDPQTQKQISATNLELRAKKMRVAADQQALQQMKKQQTQQEPQTQNASYEPEGELVDERTRYAEKTGRSATTGRPSVEGGNPEIAAQNKRIAPATIGGSRQEPKDRRGRVKPVLAGEPGSGRQDPAHMVKVRRTKRQRLSDISTQQMQDTRGT